MSESPAERGPRPLFDEPTIPHETVAERPSFRERWGLWLGALAVVVAALAAAVMVSRSLPTKEETAATRAAVKNYAELFHQPRGEIYRYCTIKTRSLGDGNWRVSITRVIVPDTKGGYGITSLFNVDRSGRCEYVGQKEGRLD